MKTFWKVLAIVFLLIIVLSTVLVMTGRRLYGTVVKTTVDAKQAYQYGKNQDMEKLGKQIKVVETDLQNVEGSLSQLAWLKYIPFLGAYQEDAKHLVNGSIYTTQAADIAVETIVPYSDLLGLKGNSSFVSGSADERIKTAVETLDKMVPNIDKIAQKLDLAEKEIEKVNFDRYPEKIGSFVVRDRLVSLKSIFSETASLFVDAQPLLRKMPDLLGNNQSKRYLVIFQNDAELRATGGFMTAFAIFKVDKGKLQVERSDDIYKLDEAKRKTLPAPAPIALYHKGVSNYELRDSNLSPDYKISMQEFEDLLDKTQVDLGDYEGIIALDTHVLVNTVKILGSFDIAGRTFSADTDKRCDCPKVIYELEDYSTRPVAYVRDDRKGIIGTLLYQIMQRALGVSPSQYWGKLSQMLLEEAKQKHLLFYFHDKESQKGIESLNYGGRIKPYSWDYLHINNVNFAGAKSNLFVKSSVKQQIEISDLGEMSKTLTINYKNPTPASNCNLEAGQLCLNGILRNWLRIYVPKGSQLVEFTGSEKETVVYQELDKTVFEGFMTVKPQGSAQVVIKYKIPIKVQGNDPYRLLVQKQPGTSSEEYHIIRNGKEVEKFILETDREISFPK